MNNILKAIIAKIVFYMGGCRFLFFLSRCLTGKYNLSVFTYHRITKNEGKTNHYLNYDRGLDVITFETQIKLITKFYKTIDIDEFVQVVRGKKRLKKDAALITFDDADSKFIKNALPILEKYNCKCVIFAPTAYIDTDRRFWHVQVSTLLRNINTDGWKKLQASANDLPEDVKTIILDHDLSAESQRGEICRHLVHQLDKLADDVIDKIIASWIKLSRINDKSTIACMSWEDLAYLEAKGCAIESHSVSHRKLAGLDPQSIDNELADSKKVLEHRLGKMIRSICYPAGSYNSTVMDIAGNVGYKVGFTTKPGACAYPDSGKSLFKLPRWDLYEKDKFSICLFLARIAASGFIKSAKPS